MASISRSGVIGGGAAAGLVLVAGGVALALFVILPELEPAVAEGYSPGVIPALVAHFALGFLVVWVYAGFRPRYGAGHRSVMGAALTVWAAEAATVVAVAALFPILPFLTAALVIVWMLIETAAASAVGAGVYRRRVSAVARRRGRSVGAAEY